MGTWQRKDTPHTTGTEGEKKNSAIDVKNYKERFGEELGEKTKAGLLAKNFDEGWHS